MFMRVWQISSGLCVSFALSCFAFAAPGTNQIATKEQPVAKELATYYDWPAGVIALVDDLLRENGWNPWFSGWPNDVKHFEFKLREHDDLKPINRKLERIAADVKRIELDPRKEPGALGFSTSLPKGNGVAVVFSIGSQKLIDQWHQRLPITVPPRA